MKVTTMEIENNPLVTSVEELIAMKEKINKTLDTLIENGVKPPVLLRPDGKEYPAESDTMGWLEFYIEDGRDHVYLEVTIPENGLYFDSCHEPKEAVPLAKFFMSLGWNVGLGT
jgi:hypothetical protein